jgi:hypothetical protein
MEHGKWSRKLYSKLEYVLRRCTFSEVCFSFQKLYTLLFFFCVLYCSLFLYCTVSAYDVCAATLTEGFPCFFLSCKANSRVQIAKTGHGPHFTNQLIFYCYVLLIFYCYVWLIFYCYVCFVLCILCIACVNVYCTTATGCQPNCSYIYISYHIIYHIISYRIVSYHISYHIISYITSNNFFR